MEKYPTSSINQSVPRLEKAYTALDKVKFTTETTGTVQSSDGTKEYHFILSDDGKHECECPDNKYRHVVCYHLRAVLMVKAQQKKLEVEHK